MGEDGGGRKNIPRSLNEISGGAMKKHLSQIIPIALILLASLVPEFPSQADAAPPLRPPGSNIAPGQQTMVQMLSENVLLLIRKDASEKYYASISAEFLMENQGNADESMQVRFPLENVNGMGGGRGDRPTVRNFTVQLDGQWLAPQTVQEPFQEGGEAISWSTFPVQFPAGKKVYIRVFYDTDLGDLESNATVEYILETGSGWYGPIGQAAITLRLPFEASETTVEQSDSRPVTFVGREARYVFENLEPGPSDNIEYFFVYPAVWMDILDLERRTGENPKDIASIIKLADLYIDLATYRCYGFSNEHTQYLAETIVAQGLFYSPDNPDLLAERAKTNYSRSVCGEQRSWDSPQVQSISREVDYVLSLDPDNPIALMVKEALEWWKENSSYLPPSDEKPISPSETPTALIPSATIAPINSPVRTIPKETASVGGPALPSPEVFGGIGVVPILLGILLFLGGAAAGAYIYKVRRH
jgi:hypothetical protein